MQQLSIEYFYPLTEQIELDLDYSPCLKYEEDKHKNSLYIGNRFDQWSTVAFTSSTDISPYMTIDKDAMPIMIRSTEKPNLLQRYAYKTLGLKWETK